MLHVQRRTLHVAGRILDGFSMLFSGLASKGGTRNQSTELHLRQNNVQKEAWRSYPERPGVDHCVIWRCTRMLRVQRCTLHVARHILDGFLMIWGCF